MAYDLPQAELGKDMHRAARRHHEARLRNTRRHDRNPHDIGDAANDVRAQGRTLHTAKECTCEKCGNPRKYLQQPTRQERSLAELDESYRRAPPWAAEFDPREEPGLLRAA